MNDVGGSVADRCGAKRLPVVLVLAITLGLAMLGASCNGPPPRANLDNLQPASLELEAAVGETASGTISFSNTGGATLDFTVEVDEQWLSVTPDHGALAPDSSQTLDVQASCPALGSYEGSVTIVWDRGTMVVDVVLTCAEEDAAIWQVDPDSLSFFGVVGGEPPASQTFSLTNAGSLSGTFVVASASTWIGLDPDSGSLAPGASQDIAVSIASCTQVGDDQAEVTVNGGESEASVDVLRHCSEEPHPAISDPDPKALKLTASPGQEAVGAVAFKNLGTAALSFNVVVHHAWLTADPLSGSVAADEEQPLTVTATCPQTPGNYSGALSINSNDPDPDRSSRLVEVDLACTFVSWAVVPQNLAYRGTVSDEPPDAQDFALTNDGTGEGAYSIASDQDWVALDPDSGSLSPGASDTITVTVDACTSAGLHEATVTVSGEDATATVEVTLECEPPPPADFVCEEVDEGNTGEPRLECFAAEAGVSVVVPWQGQSVTVESLPLDDLSNLPASNEFEPMRTYPIINFGIYTANPGQLLTQFDPPLEITVAYTDEDFKVATPFVEEGELGLGAWDNQLETWVPLGHGVFTPVLNDYGFWIADPVQSDSFTLQGQPRFMMQGSASGGDGVARIAESSGHFILDWGAMDWHPEKVLIPFDGPCQGTGTVVCTASDAGIEVTVPPQGKEVAVVALPLHRSDTLTPTPLFDGEEQYGEVSMIRPVINFIVIDVANPSQVIDEFDPPLEFDVEYRTEDRLEADDDQMLRVAYWDEINEEFVVLGEGFVEACVGSPFCRWGRGVNAEAIDEGGFYIENADATGGNALGRFDKWGDRIVIFGN